MSGRAVYIAEDDEDIRELLIYALNGAGFEAVGFRDGAAFLERARKVKPDIAILDIMLPGELDGLEVLRRVRAESASAALPVIMLTAKGAESDRVRGLNLGADDYVTKPFGVTELIARINAVLRRAAPSADRGGVISIGDLEIDLKRRAVMAGGAACALTYTEFELLRYLADNKGIVLSRDMIMDAVWGGGFFGESRTVDMHVKSLRKKLGSLGSMIKTERNVGYRLGE